MGENEKDILTEEQIALAAAQEAARAKVKAEADADAAKRAAGNAAATAALQASHDAQTSALNTYNQAQYSNVGQILSDVQTTIAARTKQDEKARERENAYRYISGLGDTLSAVANLVGTAHGASNQQQTYNSHAVVQKAEEARKARKIEIEDLSKRLDEMKTRQRELKAAGSLKEAELKAAMAKEKAALIKEQNTAEDAAKKYWSTKSDQAAQNIKEDYIKERELDIREKNADKDTGKDTTKPKIRKIMGKDGVIKDFDVSAFKDFDGDYQKALDAAIKAGASGLSDEEIEAYNRAVKMAQTDSGKALQEWLRVHTPREVVLERMGINNPLRYH